MGDDPVRHVADDERRRRLARRAQHGATGRADRDPAGVAAALALLHGTDPSTVHLQLHARCDVDQTGIDAFLHDERALLRHTCLRRTVHVMPRDVAPLAHGAFNGPLVEKLRGNLVGWIANTGDEHVSGLDDRGREAWLRALEDEVVDHLAANGPTGGNALADAIDGLRLVFEPMPGRSYSRPIRLTSKVLEVVAADARITRARPTGDLTSAAWDWVAMEDWWPGGLEVPEEPLVGLMARYLATFGPVTTTDAGWWTGLGKTKVRRAFAELGAVRVTVDGPDDEAWLLPDDVDEADTLGDHHAALLPGLDAAAMAHKDRDWWLGQAGSSDPADALYDRNGNAGPIAWVGGRAVGAWDQRDDGSVVVGLLEDVDSDARDALEAEAARTATWLGEVRVKPRYPVPLQKALHAGDSPAGVTVLG